MSSESIQISVIPKHMWVKASTYKVVAQINSKTWKCIADSEADLTEFLEEMAEEMAREAWNNAARQNNDYAGYVAEDDEWTFEEA